CCPRLRCHRSVRVRLGRPPRSPPFPYTTLFRSTPRLGVLDDLAYGQLGQPRGARIRDVHDDLLPDHARNIVVQRHIKARRTPYRSEEHTSELQSRENLVCRLLLEKKKRPSTLPC